MVSLSVCVSVSVVVSSIFLIRAIRVFNYDDQKSRNVILRESNNLEMTVSENHNRKL